MPETAPTPGESGQALRAGLDRGDSDLLVVVAHHLDGLVMFLDRGCAALCALEQFTTTVTTASTKQRVALADIHERAEALALRLNAVIGELDHARRDFMKAMNS